MALREITVDGQPILVEVADLTVEGQPPVGTAGDGFEYTSVAERIGDMKDRIDAILQALAAPVQATFKAAGAAEWTLEVGIGFNGKSGIPFVAAGEANASIKVTATWKPGS